MSEDNDEKLIKKIMESFGISREEAIRFIMNLREYPIIERKDIIYN